MAQPRTLASLSSGLLARKGHARPAMRPQGFATPNGPAPVDDLGWNDMGEPAPVAEAVPPVLIERAALAQEIARTPEPPMGEPPTAEPVAPETIAAPEARAVAAPAVRPISLATAARIGRDTAKQTAKSGKAAFTLRLDHDRHLRLRLASAVTNRSSQALVSAALDAFLETLPEVETLVAQLPAPGAKR